MIDGAGKAFVAGADVKFFVDKIQEDAIPDIYEFTANGHEVLNKLENSDKVTIALTTGLALGGRVGISPSLRLQSPERGEHNLDFQKLVSVFIPTGRYPAYAENMWNRGG